ncbi:helix-turn-helix transcriptional regulator [Epilithonimonas sp.]|uniref:helix-turn-helix domain-containing protein n=1 Tax=Epilithonimonas sp. TaxID=2894511 RepID=UPI0028A8821E|nr:helix-turn-helix transcriptional regulator [Epilithonimonas sp.]
MNLGNAIKNQRKIIGMSQGELAKQIQKTQSYLSLIEKNKKEPNLSVLKEISEVLEIPLPILFFKSIEDTDIKEDKKFIFNSLDAIINSVFLDEK